MKLNKVIIDKINEYVKSDTYFESYDKLMSLPDIYPSQLNNFNKNYIYLYNMISEKHIRKDLLGNSVFSSANNRYVDIISNDIIHITIDGIYPTILYNMISNGNINIDQNKPFIYTYILYTKYKKDVKNKYVKLFLNETFGNLSYNDNLLIREVYEYIINNFKYQSDWVLHDVNDLFVNKNWYKYSELFIKEYFSKYQLNIFSEEIDQLYIRDYDKYIYKDLNGGINVFNINNEFIIDDIIEQMKVKSRNKLIENVIK